MSAVVTELIGLAADTSDYRPGIPGAPVDMHVDPTNHAIFTIICGIPAVFVVLLAILSAAKYRNYLWPLFLIGGTIAMFVEPILDYLGGVWWPLHGDWEAFTMLGVNIPWLVALVYPWLLGGQAYAAYRAFERGTTRRHLWQLVGLFALTDIAIETVGLRMLNAYAYFGTQPFNLWGLPLWYVPCNAVGPLFAGALFYVVRRRLTGIRALASVGLFPFAFLGTYAAAGFPVWISLNSGWPMWAAVLAGSATFAIAYLLVLLISDMTGTTSTSQSQHVEQPPSGATDQREGEQRTQLA